MMMENRRVGRTTMKVGLLVAAVMVTGCYQHNYTVGAGAPAGSLVEDQWRHHWLWGLISPDKELELSEVCPSGDATIHQEVHFLNGLVSVLTSGIYSPTTVQVRCAGADADLELGAEDVALIVSDPDFLEWVEEVLPERSGVAERAQEELQER